MIDFQNISREELERNGLFFQTTEEAKLFAEIVVEDLEVRIGEEISSRSTQQQLEEFDRCKDPAECREWLDKNCPEYKTIISDKWRELEQEIMDYKLEISGVVLCDPTNGRLE